MNLKTIQRYRAVLLIAILTLLTGPIFAQSGKQTKPGNDSKTEVASTPAASMTDPNAVLRELNAKQYELDALIKAGKSDPASTSAIRARILELYKQYEIMKADGNAVTDTKPAVVKPTHDANGNPYVAIDEQGVVKGYVITAQELQKLPADKQKSIRESSDFIIIE